MSARLMNPLTHFATVTPSALGCEEWLEDWFARVKLEPMPGLRHAPLLRTPRRPPRHEHFRKTHHPISKATTRPKVVGGSLLRSTRYADLREIARPDLLRDPGRMLEFTAKGGRAVLSIPITY